MFCYVGCFFLFNFQVLCTVEVRWETCPDVLRVFQLHVNNKVEPTEATTLLALVCMVCAQAEMCYTQALAAAPEADTHFNMGVLISDDPTRVDEAEMQYRAALQLDPWHTTAYIFLAKLYTSTNRLEQAKQVRGSCS